MRATVVDLLLVLAVLCELICVVGVIASATLYDRLHYAGATTSVAPFLLLVAIALRQPHPYTNPVWNALFDALALFVLNNVLSHAIARVAQARDV
ncbi:MAG TPA: monovalent cation/H(+) antiporter subunit G [Gaiellaceae bacterium]|nr:monovalent cation/H(+) antiporter subunit G [Gaiellaceae bacterium]